MRRGAGEERRRLFDWGPRPREEDGLVREYERGGKQTLNFGFGERGIQGWGRGIFGECRNEFDNGIHAFIVLKINVCALPCCYKELKEVMRS